MSPRPSSSAGHRERGLSRDDIVRAALELADSEGLDGLTMRRLGAVLGRSPMGLYYYVSDREDLLRGIYELLNSELSPPSALEIGRASCRERV